MIARRLIIDIDDAEPGMTLADVLKDAGGGTLLPSGAELTESMLTSLRRRGIEQVAVVDDKVSEEELAAERERAEQRLAQLFRKCADRNASIALRESILHYRMGEAT